MIGARIDLGPLVVVGVPAAAGLAAEPAGLEQALVIGTRRHAPVVEETLVDDLARREVHVDAGEVHQLERPHAEAASVAHHGIDLGRRGAAFLVDPQPLGADCRAAEIDQEARRVADDHRHARLALAQRHHGVDHPLRGVGGADDLDQLHQRHGVEIVHAADAVAVLQRPRDRGDADGGRVGRQDGVGRDDGLEFPEQLLLHLEVLEYGFHDDMAALEVLELVGDAEIGVRLGEIGVGQPALGNQTLQGLDDRSPGLCRPTRCGIEHDRLHAALRRHLRNTAAHGTGADHAYGEIGAVDIESHLAVLLRYKTSLIPRMRSSGRGLSLTLWQTPLPSAHP